MMKNRRNSMLAVAWAVIVGIASYPIILQEIFQHKLSPTLQTGISLFVVLLGLALTFVWKTIRPLRSFFGLFIVLLGMQWLVHNQVDRLLFYQDWLSNPSFSFYMPAELSLNLMVTVAIIGFLFLLRKRREEFFLAKGNIAAEAEPVGWLGIKKGEKWNSVGRNFAIYLSLGTLAFLVIAGRPSLQAIQQVLPFLPVVIAAAALNAFNEEVTYKAAFLSVLEDAVGKKQALLLMAAFFGILHFYGVPYGIVGVLLATFLGWVLGKSMLETRGLFWAWFLHFLQDILIFAFMAIGSITPGG